jgi:hypothetical protein
MSRPPTKDVLAKIKRLEDDRLKQSYQESRHVVQPAPPAPDPALADFIGEDGYLPGERRAAELAMADAEQRRTEKIDYLRDRGGVRSGPRSHTVRGGNEGFITFEPTRREWQQWADKIEAKAALFDEQLGQPEQPEETFRERYWRENGHKIRNAKERISPDLVDPEGERIRLKEDAILETPPANPTPEQAPAPERFAARLTRRRRTHSEVAKSQRRDSAGRFS